MIVRVKLFAVARQAAGADFVELELSEGATVADVRRRLVAEVPNLTAVARHLLLAVNADYAAEGRVIRAGDELACIPPVSGG